MARLPYLDPEHAEPRVADLLSKAPDLGIFRMVANAQGAFPGWMRFGGALFDPAEIDPLLRELAITRVAAMTPGADYEWVQHAAITLEVGGTAISTPRSSVPTAGWWFASPARSCATPRRTRKPSPP